MKIYLLFFYLILFNIAYSQTLIGDDSLNIKKIEIYTLPKCFHELINSDINFNILEKLIFNNEFSQSKRIEKIIDISVGGWWEADRVNFFQNRLRKDFLGNIFTYVEVLKNKNTSKMRSFFYFLFDDIHLTKKKLNFNNYKQVKKFDKKTYIIMKSVYKNVINDAKLFQGKYKEY